MKFTDLNLISPIIDALDLEGYTTPTPIQQQAIPAIFSGKDMIGCAQTGTGKTAAFSIPILQLLAGKNINPKDKGRHIRSLILTPTRELALQIGDSLKTYGKNLPLVSNVIFGGVGRNPQIEELSRGVDILVATPGRLLDFLNERIVDLRHIEYFVLDEADRMLDMGFIHDVRKVLARLPKQRQSLFFSATMPAEIQKLADEILKDPSFVSVTPVSSVTETIQQQVYFVEKANKNDLLQDLLKDKDLDAVLVFTRTKHGADKLVKGLIRQGVNAAAIHANKSQTARQNALSHFKEGRIRVLAATDIAARGIDIDNLKYVVNYDIPNVPETYVHRIGRTGRAGASGVAYSFCMEEERPYLRDIQKLIKKELPVLEHAYHEKTTPETVRSSSGQDKGRVTRPAEVPKEPAKASKRRYWRNKRPKNQKRAMQN